MVLSLGAYLGVYIYAHSFRVLDKGAPIDFDIFYVVGALLSKSCRIPLVG